MRKPTNEQLIQTAMILEDLTKDEGDEVKVMAPNMDFAGPAHRISVRGAWTNYVERTYTGHTRLDALNNARKVRRASEQ